MTMGIFAQSKLVSMINVLTSPWGVKTLTFVRWIPVTSPLANVSSNQLMSVVAVEMILRIVEPLRVVLNVRPSANALGFNASDKIQDFPTSQQ